MPALSSSGRSRRHTVPFTLPSLPRAGSSTARNGTTTSACQPATNLTVYLLGGNSLGAPSPTPTPNWYPTQSLQRPTAFATTCNLFGINKLSDLGQTTFREPRHRLSHPKNDTVIWRNLKLYILRRSATALRVDGIRPPRSHLFTTVLPTSAPELTLGPRIGCHRIRGTPARQEIMNGPLNKRQQARNEKALQDLVHNVPGNNMCADCQARNPGSSLVLSNPPISVSMPCLISSTLC